MRLLVLWLVLSANMEPTYSEAERIHCEPRVVSIATFNSEDEVFKIMKNQLSETFTGNIVVIRSSDNYIIKNISAQTFYDIKEKERLANTKPRMPRLFTCGYTWDCVGNEKESKCKCISETMCKKKGCIAKPFMIEISGDKECSDTVCRIPVKK